MRLSQNCQSVRTNFVGDIAVAGNSVRADDNGLHPAVFMTQAAILSVISVTGIPCLDNSKAVKRAPCNNGRVSSA